MVGSESLRIIAEEAEVRFSIAVPGCTHSRKSYRDKPFRQVFPL